MGLIILGIVLVSFGVGVVLAFKEWKQKRPLWTYRNVEVRLYTPRQTPERDVEILKWLNNDLADAYYTLERKDEIFAECYKTPTWDYDLKHAITVGINEIEKRIEGFSLDKRKLKLYVQPYPICHSGNLKWTVSHGCVYLSAEAIYVSVMPKEKGGLAATASLCIHESAHLHLYDTIGDTDAKHRRKIWGKVDEKVEL